MSTNITIKSSVYITLHSPFFSCLDLDLGRLLCSLSIALRMLSSELPRLIPLACDLGKELKDSFLRPTLGLSSSVPLALL